MYAPASPFSRPIPAGDRSMSGLYRQVGVETSISSASPHQLVKLLLDGFFDAVAESRGHMRKKDVEAKAKAITRAIAATAEMSGARPSRRTSPVAPHIAWTHPFAVLVGCS